MTPKILKTILRDMVKNCPLCKGKGGFDVEPDGRLYSGGFQPCTYCTAARRFLEETAE